MGLFSGWFSKKEDKADNRFGADWRRTERRRVATAWPPVEARFGKERAQVLDMSETGFCLAADENRAPKQMLVEIVQGEETLSRGYAMQAWGVGARVGYHFATGLAVERIQEKRAAAAAKAAQLMPTRLAAREAILEAARKAREAEEAERAAQAEHEARRAHEKQQERSAISFLAESELQAIQDAAAPEAVSSEPLPFAAPASGGATGPKKSSSNGLRDRLKL